ncbi:uncharacterized protein LOC62_04G005326 [Vanrija pseudolonga]|uniref:Uncharacterized protein n=1 Tax=Vanrija pseudolonga TaxID=143232 RepID=A0AAF1BI25_9TREE|nr:hypothetical protein LOC62_04G005326 [Vanrija pseudolonga]WOO81807.1 hypothetical protein LOC62_04G005326 [Vanrija pseudolonga]
MKALDRFKLAQNARRRRATSSRGVIDPSAFPHIMDAIIENADMMALVALRGTCQRLGRLVDKLLFTHAQLVLYPAQQAYGIHTHRPLAFLTLPVNTTVRTASTFPVLPWCPAAVKILDVLRPNGDPAWTTTVNLALAAEFTSVHTVRQQLEPYWDIAHYFPSNHTTVYYDVVPPRFRRIGSGTQHYSPDRAVYHFRPDDESDHEPVSFATAYLCTDFVFVFWPSSTVPPFDWPFARMQHILRESGTREHGGTTANIRGRRKASSSFINSFVVVGIQNVCPDLVRYEPDSPESSPLTDVEILHEIISAMQVPLRIGDRLRECGRTISLEQWMEELGDRAAIEGAWMTPREAPLNPPHRRHDGSMPAVDGQADGRHAGSTPSALEGGGQRLDFHVACFLSAFTLSLNSCTLGMPATLDYSAHPHIIETIVRCAPVAALIPLRATSKAIQPLVDAILFDHVQLQPFPADGKDWASGAVIGLTLPADTSLSVSSPLPRLPWVPGAVRMLDDTKTWNDDDEYAITNDAFSSLQTIRQLCTDDYAYDHNLSDVPTAVLFVDASRYHHTIYPCSKRMVAHIRGGGGNPPVVETACHDNVREFVFVFWSPMNSVAWCLDVVIGALYTQRRNSETIPESIEVVGLDLPPHTATSSERIRAQNALEGRFGAKLHGLHDQSDDHTEWAYEMEQRLLFHTMDEWRATLGDRLYLEGTWMQPRPGPDSNGKWPETEESDSDSDE